MTSHYTTIKIKSQLESNDKPLETPKSLKHLILIQFTAKYTSKQDHILTKTFIFSEILEKNEGPTKNPENSQKEPKYIKIGLKSLK